MAHIVYFTLSPLQTPFHSSSRPSNALSLNFSVCRRGSSLVTRGAPGTSTYIFAFVLPLSLLAATVFTALRIDDKIERDFLEEVAVNKAIMEENEDSGEVIMPMEKKPSLQRRDRPKREAETLTM